MPEQSCVKKKNPVRCASYLVNRVNEHDPFPESKVARVTILGLFWNKVAGGKKVQFLKIQAVNMKKKGYM